MALIDEEDVPAAQKQLLFEVRDLLAEIRDLLKEQNEDARRVREEMLSVPAMQQKLSVSLQATQLAYRELQAMAAPETERNAPVAQPAKGQRHGGKRG